MLIAPSVVDGRLLAEPASQAGGRIAFTFGESGADRPAQLSVMDADGKNRRVLPPFGIDDLSWSPGGRSIAFLSAGAVYLTNVDGPGGTRRLVRNAGFNLDWSPNGRSIAFERGGDIWVVDLNSGRQRRIVHHGQSPEWSPDARKLAFERGRDLVVLDVVEKKERRVMRNGKAASWSPDGRTIAFDRGSFIYVMRSDGTRQRRLFEGWYPVWSPDGQEIAFEGSDGRRGYNDAIIRAHLDGSGRRVLFGQRPYCGCGGFDWSRPP